MLPYDASLCDLLQAGITNHPTTPPAARAAGSTYRSLMAGFGRVLRANGFYPNGRGGGGPGERQPLIIVINVLPVLLVPVPVPVLIPFPVPVPDDYDAEGYDADGEGGSADDSSASSGDGDDQAAEEGNPGDESFVAWCGNPGGNGDDDGRPGSPAPGDDSMLVISDQDDPLPEDYMVQHQGFLDANRNAYKTYESQRALVNRQASAVPHLLVPALTLQQQAQVNIPPKPSKGRRYRYQPKSLKEFLILPHYVPDFSIIWKLLSSSKLPNLHNWKASVVVCSIDSDEDQQKKPEWEPIAAWIDGYLHKLNVFQQQGWLKRHPNWKVPNEGGKYLIPNAELAEVLSAPLQLSGTTPLNITPIRRICFRLLDLVRKEPLVGDNRANKPQGPLGLGWGVMFLLPMISTMDRLGAQEWVAMIDEAQYEDWWWMKLVKLCEDLGRVWELWAGELQAFFRNQGPVRRIGADELTKAFVDFVAEVDAQDGDGDVPMV